MPHRLPIAILTIAAVTTGTVRTAADEPAMPARYLRSQQLLDTGRTAAAPRSDSRQLPVVTANAMREIPGAGSLSETNASGDSPPPTESAAAAPDATAADVITDTPDVDSTFSLIIGVCLAGLAFLIGLWLRIRQSQSATPGLGSTAEADTPNSVAIALPPGAAETLNPLEALIRNELALVEEPVQIPACLEFYGWPAVSPLLRRDPAHAERNAGQSTGPTLAGPHFLRRRPALAAADQAAGSQARAGHRQRASGPAAASPAEAAQRHAGESTAPRPQAEPERVGEAPAVPGPLDRALERLLRKQT